MSTSSAISTAIRFAKYDLKHAKVGAGCIITDYVVCPGVCEIIKNAMKQRTRHGFVLMMQSALQIQIADERQA